MRKAFVLAILAGLALAAPASAATIQVETTKDQFGPGGTGKCALREAVQAANENQKFGGCSKGNGADRIVLRAGVYRLTINTDGSWENENVEGDLDVSSRVTIAGKGSGKTAIDGNGRESDERILHMSQNNLTLQGLTLRNARELDDDGGGIWNEGSGLLTMRRIHVLGNAADGPGGGIAVTGNDGDLLLERSLVANNSSTSYGGGISGYSGGDRITIRKSRIVANDGDSTGGIITGSGVFTLANSVVADNKGYDYGGGIDLYDNSRTIIRNSTISGNRGVDDDYGGGIYDEGSDGPVLIEGSTISNNYVGYGGGGIYAAYNTWTIRNSTISGNQAMQHGGSTGYGGGIFNDGATMSLQSVTVTNNSAYDTGGIYSEDGVAATTLKNSIIARNRDFGQYEWTEDCYESSGEIISAGHNLSGDGSCGDLLPSDIAGDSSDQLFPGLAPLSSNGGPTRTHALLRGSPAINKGQGCPKRDQRGVRRAGHGRCDIGAFEK